MMVTIIKFDRHIDRSTLKKLFCEYPCDSIAYGVDELNRSYLKIYDSDNVAYFSSSFINNLLKQFNCKDLEITVIVE